MANQTNRKRRSANSKKKTNASKTKNTAKKSRKKTGTSQRRNTSATKKVSSKKPVNKNTKQQLSEENVNMRVEIPIVASFFVMLLLMLSNFGICGTAGNILSSFFFGLFGCVQYVMPMVAFVAICVLLINEYSGLAMKKCLAAFLFLMMVSGYVQLMKQTGSNDIYQLFAIGIKDRLTGGIIGGGFACLLKRWFGMIGAGLIMACITILSLIMLTQRSVVEFFRKWFGIIQNALGERNTSRPVKETKRRKTLEDREREKQCEDKVKKLEEEKLQARLRRKMEKKEEKEVAASADFKVPTFKPSDEVKHKDSVKELHPEIYPFTQEDGQTDPFKGELDLTAFSFNSGKSSEEYRKEVQEHIQFGEALEKQIEEASHSISSKGMREIEHSDEDYVVTVEDGFEEDPAYDIFPSIDEEYGPAKIDSQDSEEVTTDEIVFEADDVVESDIIIHKEEKKPEENEKKKNDAFFSVKKAEGADYTFPPLSLLQAGERKSDVNHDEALKNTAIKLQETLRSFGVNVKITDISFGPTVTRYEMVPEQGTKVSKIVSLTDDIKLNLAAEDIRIEAPIPGKSAIGIEVPNKDTLTVHFRELIDSKRFRDFRSKLAFAVGKDIGGQTVISDIAKMPHLLIAGATGSGKSVCINTLIMSILYKARPDEVKLIMIDPKMVELSIYNGIPHLLIPVVTDPKKASGALNWAVAEMTDRYNRFTEVGVRNIAGYNDKIQHLEKSGEVEAGKLKPMPQIVVIIDELADLMMVAPGEVEDAIVRLSQLARAAGIHLVIATQRPSVNVITGLIKANVPSRIAFAVSSGVDSRTIIDMNGAEKLLGKGDMLFFPAGSSKPSRVQGAFISDDEIFSVVEFLKENETIIEYDNTIEESIAKSSTSKSSAMDRDEYFEDAARFIMEKEKASIGMLQRMFKIGFNRAARIMDQLAEAGIVGPEEGTKPRKILMSPEQLEEYFEEYL
ncbi:MAG: DNA translocase FtsK [Eubacteriales bacterium]|nr:DNA translocase FtsK [Eubacteriales bacterium]